MTDGRPTSAHPAASTDLSSSADDPVRTQERRRLASELNDIVAHHLSNVALRTMGRLDLTDLADLRTVLGDVNHATASALFELRLMVHVLEDGPDKLVEVDPVGELSQRVLPTQAATRWQRRLTQAGLVSSYSVPHAADRLAMSVQSTIIRTFDVTAEAALQYATVDARCRTTVDLGSTRVTVKCVTSLPITGPDDGQLSRGLRGLRERVDLTHGQFAAGPRISASLDPEWVVTVGLPLD